MGLWSCFTLITLLGILAICQVDGGCELEKISSTCEYYIKCNYDVWGLVRVSTACPAPEYESKKKIHLFLRNINLDISWTEYGTNPNDLLIDYIKTIEFNQVDKIPETLKIFRYLEELALSDWLDSSIDINKVLEFNLEHLKKINASHSNIKNFTSSGFIHSYGRTNPVENIDLSNNLLEIIPSHVFYTFSKLKHLNLSHNLFTAVERMSFESLNNLETLDLSFNRLEEIGQSFVPLSNLRELYLQNNNFSAILATDLNALVNLEKLNLNANVLGNLEDDALKALGNLKEIDLSNNKLTKVSKVLFLGNTKIVQLLLTNNIIQKLESDAFKGKTITTFDFKGNDLRGSLQRNSFKGIATNNLDLSFGKISTLEALALAGLQTEVLNMSNNIITSIDAKSFRGIQSINELNLSHNNLTRIDFESEDMRRLLILNARNNQITNISQMTMKNFVALIKLDLSYNKITILDPKIFYDLNELRFLDISNNLLFGSLKANIFQGLFAVTKIHLENNKFTDIDNNAFSGLNSLQLLNCSNGQLINIHFDAFKNTGSIEILDLSQNMLDNFKVNTTSIISVKELHLNDNNIHNVTLETISGIRCLENVNFGNNNIIKLESKLFRELKNLKVLDLSNNPLVDLNEVLSNLSFLAELKLPNTNNLLNFESMSNVSINRLDISRNNIENINKVFVYKINDIHYLDLHANKISSIDKDSFQSMHTLIWLDLSFNLITYIQPGAFLQTNGLKSLNLHENALSTLQYGVLNGLYDLETLNLSSNAIHEFRKTVLISTPKISTIALDNNIIEHIKFEEFEHLTIKLITIGGNPIDCHIIAQFIEGNPFEIYSKPFEISAEILDHHNENFHGIRCISNTNLKNTFDNTSSGNNTAAFWIMFKEFEKIHMTLDKYTKENTNIQKNIVILLRSMYELQNNTNNYFKLQTNAKRIESIEEILRKINVSENIHTTSHYTNISDKNELNSQLQENVKMLKDEKDHLVKEMLEIIEEFKNSKKITSVSESNHKDKELKDEDGVKGVLYFVAVCMVILIVFSVTKNLYKYFKPRYSLFKRNNEAGCSTQQMANIIELQENE